MKTNYTPPRYKFDTQRHGDRNGKRLLLSAAAMTLLMGVTACEGPPIIEYEGVDEHAGQDYLNPPEVETGFEEPSSGAEGEIPLPLGFTEESWIEYLLEKLDEGTVVDYGGTDVVVATMDSPLVYDGPVPTVEFIALEEEEMDALGVEPGDPAPGSTAIDTRIYIYPPETDPSKIFDSAFAGETSSRGSGDMFWADRVGSPLAFATNSSIAITGCSDYGTLGSWPWLFTNRTGIARFYGSWLNETRDVGVNYPSLPCLWPLVQTRTTVYAMGFFIDLGNFTISMWLVNYPEAWIAVGQDGWDSIELFGDEQAKNEPLMIEGVVVTNNNKQITSSDLYSSPVGLHGPMDSHDLNLWIYYYKWSKAFYSSHPVVQWAVSDYAQAASAKYPVLPHPTPWNGHTVPYDWCTEFASWPFRTGTPTGTYPNLPVASTTGDPNIGVKEFYDWGVSEGWPRTPLEFGQDESLNPLIINGPTYPEWAGLADGVKEGDYLARREEHSSGTHVHSMIVVGWLKDDGTDVGPLYFDPARRCNRVLVVDGNTGGPSAPGSWGLGSTVNVSTRVVCRQDEDSSGLSIDPQCDFNGDLVTSHWEQCNVRLWDTLSDGAFPPKSSFFIDMSY